MKVNTINVIEYAEDVILGVHSFSNDDEGRKEAGECFESIIRENGDEITKEEIEDFIEEGMYEQGEFQVFLINSSNA